MTSFAKALSGSAVVILAVPGPAVAELAAAYGATLAGALVIDTNTMGAVANSRADLPPTVR